MNTLKDSTEGCHDYTSCVTVEFLCEECGKYEVIKNKSTLTQYCIYCGKKSDPIRIVNVGVKKDGKWIIHSLHNDLT